MRNPAGLFNIRSLVMVGAAAFVALYVLSSTSYFWTSGVLYAGKHLAFVLLALLGTLWWTLRGVGPVRGRYVVFAVTVAFLALPYLVRFGLTRGVQEFVIFVQYVVFAVAVVAIASTLERSGPGVVRRVVAVLLGAILVVAVVTWLRDPWQIYNTRWGRPRLLLGFWHPKEVGSILASAALLLATSAALKVRPALNWALYGFLMLVLLFVDSRNMFLFSFIVVAAYYCAKYASYYVLWLGVAFSVAAAAWIVDRYPLLVDLATSGRLTIWSRAEYSLLGEGTQISAGGGSPVAKFHMDNYFLEYVVENGIYAVVLFLGLTFLLGFIIRHTRDPVWRRLKIAVAIALLFTSIFDAGMFSTGNLVNLVTWVYLLAAEFIFAPAPRTRAEPGESTERAPSLVEAPA